MARRTGFSVEIYTAKRTPGNPHGESIEVVDIPTLADAIDTAGAAMLQRTAYGDLHRGDEVMVYREPDRQQLYGAIIRERGEWEPYQVKERGDRIRATEAQEGTKYRKKGHSL